MQQTAKVDGDSITLFLTNGQQELHSFATAAQADARYKFITEAITWAGTPFRDCADIKGRNGGVDCAMLLVRSAVDTGLLPAFDPRPYPPRWHLHQDEERFLAWIDTYLGAKEVAEPQIGDVVVWQFGKCFSHGAILINSAEVVHSYYAAQCCLISRLDEPVLAYELFRGNTPRPIKYFSLWGDL